MFCQVTKPKIGHVLLRLRHLDLQSCLQKSAWCKRVAWNKSVFLLCYLRVEWESCMAWAGGKTIHLGDKYTSVGLQSYTEKKRIICFAGFTDDCPFATPKPLFILRFLMQWSWQKDNHSWDFAVKTPKLRKIITLLL